MEIQCTCMIVCVFFSTSCNSSCYLQACMEFSGYNQMPGKIYSWSTEYHTHNGKQSGFHLPPEAKKLT